jgi:hypothetical protein
MLLSQKSADTPHNDSGLTTAVVSNDFLTRRQQQQQQQPWKRRQWVCGFGVYSSSQLARRTDIH